MIGISFQRLQIELLKLKIESYFHMMVIMNTFWKKVKITKKFEGI